MTAPFNFAAKPTGIASTSATLANVSGFYGGEFTHTFASPGGGQSALERSHVNERFAAASGTTLAITGTLGTLNITVNSPNDASGGWDLDAAKHDDRPRQRHLGQHHRCASVCRQRLSSHARGHCLQALTATQDFRNLSYPSRTYDAAVITTTTHRRAIEDQSNRLKAVTSANSGAINQPVVEDYAGPTVFRRCRATPTSIPVATPAPAWGTAAAPTTSTIEVDAEGQTATPVFTVRAPELGCTITSWRAHAGPDGGGASPSAPSDTANYDETTVTLTPVTPAPVAPLQQ
ncbi:hypothetical protein LP420_06205 [Massilia sp. B-10]|nr:hypothetical protein LP420_06205 [Massilia sp. B-10]